jgi:VanZ family protein
MPKHIKKWLLDNSLLIAIIVSIIIITLSLINTNQIPKSSIKISDKLMHGLAYLTLFWSWRLVYRKINDKELILLIFILIVFGIFLEVLQGILTSYRTADWKDVFANIFGILIGTFTFKTAYRIVFGE